MRRRLHIVLFLSFLIFVSGTGNLFSQNEDDDETISTSDFKLNPSLSMGVGTFTFYGDIMNNHQGFHPLVSRLGYHLDLSAPLNSEFSLRFNALFGTLGANEGSLERNLNFQSQIRSAGINVEYNFGHLLPDSRSLEPFLSIGIQRFEFLSKTDLFDDYGNQYNYWSDGSIRNLPENHPDAEEAIMINRNYQYDSDIRELDLDGFGKYPEYSFAIPLSVGFQMHLHDNLKFRMGTSMHFTFTNMLDGITEESIGNRQGNARNDRFLYTSFALTYNFKPIEIGKPEGQFKEIDREPIDLHQLAFEDTDDEDDDGVIDILDRCPGTPSGVEVDKHGCPIDSDGDGVPDYLDKEPDTPEGAVVDEHGVTIDDDEIEHKYLVYSDSITEYVTERSQHVADFVMRTKKPKSDKVYMVQVGKSGAEGISQDLISVLLSIPDVKTYERGDTSFYMVGNFDDLPDAVKRKIQLEGSKVDGEVVYKDGDSFTVAEYDRSDFDDEEILETETVFRVQVGAFSKRLSKSVFSDVKGLVMLKGDDGLHRYFSGSFDNLNAAASHKVDMTMKGYEGAFIVAYRGGKRISLEEAGATMSKGREEEDKPKTSVKRELVRFKVQVGAYTRDVPASMLEKFIELGDVKPVQSSGQPTKYLLGSFESYEEAQKAQQRAKAAGIDGAFIVGDFNGKIITAKEAQELIND